MVQGFRVQELGFDKSAMSSEELCVAAEEIFSAQEEDFRNLKDAKWYKRFLRAITLGIGDKKWLVSDIRSLSKLQDLTMLVIEKFYTEQNDRTDLRINQVMQHLRNTNQNVQNLYQATLLKLRPQRGVNDLNSMNKSLLSLFLAEYSSVNGREEAFQSYKASIAKASGMRLPEGKLEPSALGRVNAADSEAFYRCALELCMLDNGYDAENKRFMLPQHILSMLDYLNLSAKKKESIEKVLLRETDNFGTNYLMNKYVNPMDGIGTDGLELTEVGTKSLEENNTQLPIYYATSASFSFTRLPVDAIVNPTRENLIPGANTLAAVIHRAAGSELAKACKKLNGCKVGEAKLTDGYRLLPKKKIIHTVGPVYKGGNPTCESLLRDCYMNSLTIAKGHDLHTIAFPLISTGSRRYPKDEASEVALRSVKEWIEKNQDYTMTVIMHCNDELAKDYYITAAEKYDIPLEEWHIENQRQKEQVSAERPEQASDASSESDDLVNLLSVLHEKNDFADEANLRLDLARIGAARILLPAAKREAIRAEIKFAQSVVIRVGGGNALNEPKVLTTLMESIVKIGKILGMSLTDDDAKAKLIQYKYYFSDFEKIKKHDEGLKRVLGDKTFDAIDGEKPVRDWSEYYVQRILWLSALDFHQDKQKKGN